MSVFFYENTSGNTRRLFTALLDFWDGRIPGIAAVDELREEGMILQFGRPPHRIDLMNQIDGSTSRLPGRRGFAWACKQRQIWVPAAYIDLPLLQKNKRAARRPKDLEDVRFLSAQLKRRRWEKHEK